MMSSDQSKTVSEVYVRFIQSESTKTWDELDNSLSMLEWLSDAELEKEAENLFKKHCTSNVRCRLNHSKSQCMAPRVVDAVAAIIELYGKTGKLHPKNRYILQYYLALDHVKFIICD